MLFKIQIYSCISVGMTVSEAVSRFNSNVSYSGLLHAVTGDVSELDKQCSFNKYWMIFSQFLKKCTWFLK